MLAVNTGGGVRSHPCRFCLLPPLGSYFHLGSLAYLGSHRGVMDLPFKTPFLKTLRGYLGAQTWRFLETYMQVCGRETHADMQQVCGRGAQCTESVVCTQRGWM